MGIDTPAYCAGLSNPWCHDGPRGWGFPWPWWYRRLVPPAPLHVRHGTRLRFGLDGGDGGGCANVRHLCFGPNGDTWVIGISGNCA